MAALHAEFWACGSEFDVVPVMHRYLELSPWMARAEAAAGSPHLVPQLVAKGWPLLAEVAPAAAAVITPLAYDPGPLVEALAATPQTFVHSNLKLDNLGTDDAGRTVVLDWEQPGRGAPLSDLAWYLAINCRRLPQSKEASIAAYREALEARGIDTGPWWDRQLALCLLGAMVQFGWEKALGGYDEELAWWETKSVTGGGPAELTAAEQAPAERMPAELPRPSWPRPSWRRACGRVTTPRPATGPTAPGRCTRSWPGRWWRPRRCRWPAAWCSTWGRGPAWPGGPRWPRGRARWWGPTCPRACCATPGTRCPPRGARSRPTRSRCRSVTAASTWCWPRSASTT